MHEEEFINKPHLFRNGSGQRRNLQNCEIPQTPQEHQLFQFSLESMLSIFLCPLLFPFNAEEGWWVQSCISAFPPTSANLILEFACVKNVHTVQSDACTVDLVISKYVTVYSHTECRKHPSLYWPPVLWLGEGGIPNDSIKCWWCQ